MEKTAKNNPRCCAVDCPYARATFIPFCLHHWANLPDYLKQELIDNGAYLPGYPSGRSQLWDMWVSHSIEYWKIKEGKWNQNK
jgi:hypothetical protein